MKSITPVNKNESKKKESKNIIRKCHCCGQITESESEIQKCVSCGKSFLPVNYFEKIHGDAEYKFDDLFDKAQDMESEDLIKGLFVLW